jgi:hypothetical protein
MQISYREEGLHKGDGREVINEPNTEENARHIAQEWARILRMGCGDDPLTTSTTRSQIMQPWTRRHTSGKSQS